MTMLIAQTAIPDWLEPLKKTHPEEILLLVLVQLIVIVLAARAGAWLFRLFGQPAVVGEIAAGLVLGPSVFGRLAPHAWHAVFHPGLHGVDPALADHVMTLIFTMLAQLGLILLLFLIGLEFDFSHLRLNGKSAVAISLSGVALPFLLGLGLAVFIHPYIEPHPNSSQPVNLLGFALFLGTALSITAIPILGRIMMDLNITRTRLGAITISAAAVDDAVGWIMLAAVASIVGGSFSSTQTLLMLGKTVAFALVLVFVARPLLKRWTRNAVSRGAGSLTITDLTVLLAILFGAAIVTNLIGIFAIFGAFLVGAVLSNEHEFRQRVTARLRDFVTVFFLPIFFTFTGLRTHVDTLDSPALWLICSAVLLAAVVGKLGGCGLAARLTGFSTRESFCIGSMMNTRALMELIVINMGYDLQVIPRSVFCMLVIMALVTTIMTTPALIRFMPGTELEPYIRSSGFLRRAAPPRNARSH